MSTKSKTETKEVKSGAGAGTKFLAGVGAFILLFGLLFTISSYRHPNDMM